MINVFRTMILLELRLDRDSKMTSDERHWSEKMLMTLWGSATKCHVHACDRARERIRRGDIMDAVLAATEAERARERAELLTARAISGARAVQQRRY